MSLHCSIYMSGEHVYLRQVELTHLYHKEVSDTVCVSVRRSLDYNMTFQ